MKILLCIVLYGTVASFGLIYKRKLKNEYDLLAYLLDFEKYLSSNIVLFKNNIVEIIDKYKIMQKEKSAKYNELFIKNNSKVEFDKKILDKYISNTSTKEIIENYLSSIGKSDYEFENEKNKKFEEYIHAATENALKKVNEKGSLYLKLSLAAGAVLCILVW